MKVYWALILKRIPFDLCYVNPRDQREVAFTGQKVVPVVQLDDDWRLDSGPICEWLDENFPERPIAGTTDQARQAILRADQWVTTNVIGLAFRSIIDNERPLSAYRNEKWQNPGERYARDFRLSPVVGPVCLGAQTQTY